MNNLNSFFEDLPGLSLNDTSNRVAEELARFSSTAPMDLDSRARMPSPTQPLVNDDDLNAGNSLIDLIERANASIRDQFYHHVASSSAS